ncbi:MAG: ABC transporter ATP-binding protein [Rhodospirillaceae bacterium]|nr:ABC transporter ATP-binding protein [Rhodospirillaceae bacterium]
MSIVFEGVSVRFGEVSALSDVSLRLTERRIGVIGDNGSGKSTFARLINGLVVPTTGRVSVEGRDTAVDGADVRRRVGFVFQNADSQIVMPTVREDVAFGLTARGLSTREITTKTDAALARFGLAALADRPCFDLSGGEKQLLALAGVCALDPAWIVLDEPTTMLDRRRAKLAMEIFAGLPQKIVVVTHHVELLTGFDRVIVIDRGRVVADDAPGAAIARYLEQPS